MKKFLAVGLALLLSSCASEHKSGLDTKDGHLPPINFNVAKIDVVGNDTPAFENQFRESKYLPEFSAALLKWAGRAFVSSGQRGTLVVSFEKAIIQEAAVDKKAKLFTAVESEKYDGQLAVRLELRDESGAVRESVVTSVEHTISVLDNISPEKRQRKIDALMHSLINELDARLRENVKKHLAGYISYAPPILTTGE